MRRMFLLVVVTILVASLTVACSGVEISSPGASKMQTTAPTPTAPPAAPDAVLPTPCPTEAEFAALTGVVADIVPTEPCAFHWRGDPLAVTPKDACPHGWSCQLGIVGKGNVLYYGGSPSVTIYAGTWRRVESYPSNDAVRDPCRFLAKSQEEGRNSTPTWTIQAGNFSCP